MNLKLNFSISHLIQDLSDLTISVELSSSNVGDISVVFDHCLTFHDHISGICKATHFHLRNMARIQNFFYYDISVTSMCIYCQYCAHHFKCTVHISQNMYRV